jgi:hypothetical protein
MNENFIAYVIVLAIAVYVGKFISNWYHEIDTRNKLAKAQVILLIELCKKHGVDEKILEEIEKATTKSLPK